MGRKTAFGAGRGRRNVGRKPAFGAARGRPTAAAIEAGLDAVAAEHGEIISATR